MNNKPTKGIFIKFRVTTSQFAQLSKLKSGNESTNEACRRISLKESSKLVSEFDIKRELLIDKQQQSAKAKAEIELELRLIQLSFIELDEAEKKNKKLYGGDD